MILAGVGHSTYLNLEEAVKSASFKALEHMGSSKVDLVLCFATTEFTSQYRRLFRYLKKHTGTSSIVGCSAMEVLTDQGELEGTPGLVVLTLASDELDFHPFLVEEASTAEGEIKEALKGHLDQGTADNLLLLLFTDIYNIRTPELLETLQQAYSRLPVVGGAASGRPEEGGTLQWARDRHTVQGLAGVLFSGPMRHSTRVAQACEPIADPYIITGAQGRVIKEIGNRPAYDIYQEALASFPPEEVGRVSKGIFAGLLYDERKYPPHRGDYLIRGIEKLDPKGGTITVVENVRPGQTIQFHVRNPGTAREELQHGVSEIAWEIGSDTPIFALYFESVGRGGRLHKEPDHDVKIIKEGLGDIPIIGFLSNAEFAPKDSRNLVHNYGAALTVVCQRGSKQ